MKMQDYKMEKDEGWARIHMMSVFDFMGLYFWLTCYLFVTVQA